jgi:hypothetical protein
MKSMWAFPSKTRNALCAMLVFAATSRAMGQTLESITPSDLQSRALETDANAELLQDTTQVPGPHGRPFVAALFAVPLLTFAGPFGPRGSEIVSPAERFAIAQLVGGGYVVNPRFRFGVMGVFNEALTGLPTGSATWQLGGVAPIAFGTFGRFVIGGGPLIGYRSAGRRQRDAGMVVLTGASIPVRKGLSVNIVTPVSALFMHRTTVSVGMAVGIAKVF